MLYALFCCTDIAVRLKPPISRLPNMFMHRQRKKKRVMANEAFRLAMKKRDCHYIYVGGVSTLIILTRTAFHSARSDSTLDH